MTVEQLLNEIARLNLEMSLRHWHENWADEKWRINLTGAVDGISLSVEGKGSDIHSILLDAVGKFTRAMRQGIPELKPALEYKQHESEREYDRPDHYETDGSNIPF